MTHDDVIKLTEIRIKESQYDIDKADKKIVDRKSN